MTGRDALAYVGLGSNLDDPVAHVCRALRDLDGIAATRLQRHSALYRSPPMGPADQPDYVNAVAALATSLAPVALLEALQAIEQAHGRERRGARWGPRSLDLDLLLYDAQVIESDRLSVPHPGMQERAFVLYPLAELDAGIRIPGQGSLSDCLRRHSPAALARIEPFPCHDSLR